MALYEPELGYYRQGVRRIGRGGDFYTSVSVGPLLGELLVHYAHGLWLKMGCPSPFLWVEQGAHDGQLAHDILTAAHAFDASTQDGFFETLKYQIIEPDPTLRQAQQQKLTEYARQLYWSDTWAEVSGQGVVFCNELLDAFAVHLVKYRNNGWLEMGVKLDEAGQLQWVEQQVLAPQLQNELTSLSKECEFQEGQIIEINLAMLDWLQELTNSGFQGMLLLADYGHAQRELFAPERMEGTLRRYRAHKSDGDILKDLGECDITSHVNFTRLVKEAADLDWRLAEFIEQGRFLTRVSASLLQTEGFIPSGTWIRQFQTLTHPNHLGQSFHMLALAKGNLAAEFCAPAQVEAACRRLGLESAGHPD